MPMPETPDQTDADAPTSALFSQNKNTSQDSPLLLAFIGTRDFRHFLGVSSGDNPWLAKVTHQKSL